MDTSFSLQDEGTVQTLLSGSEAFLPQVAVAAAADIAWNRKGIRSAVTQGILLGESIPKIARRMQGVGAQNRAQAVRWARTYTTAAENAGRVASYERAKGMGIKLKQEWLATLDGRTRHSHRQLDGEKREVGKKFSNGCRYPGDPQAAYAEICNCRCTLVPAVDGIDQDSADRFSRLPAGTTYDQWKAGKRAETFAASAKRSAKPIEWSNEAVSSLKDAAEVKAYAEKKLGATVKQGFGELSLERQKAAVAGMEYAAERYGKVEGVKLDKLTSGRNDGTFDWVANAINIGSDCGDAYITGFHEYVHAIDADRSSELDLLKSDKDAEWYNVYSSRVLSKARKEAGLARASKRYNDARFHIFGMSTTLYNSDSEKWYEVVAYALEKVEFSSAPNKLAQAIAKEFKDGLAH